MALVHFFTEAGSLCRTTSGVLLTIVPGSVTCPACAAALRARELEEEQRPPLAVRIIARIPAAG
jgi:hypothetical protein